MHRQRDFLLALAMAMSSAWAQDLPPAVGTAGSATQSRASIPDFSGAWTKPYIGIESPALGPGPVTNRSRRNGRRDVYQYVGDYTNPILKPWAADIVKRHGEISLTGVPYPSARNQCWARRRPRNFCRDGNATPSAAGQDHDPLSV